MARGAALASAVAAALVALELSAAFSRLTLLGLLGACALGAAFGAASGLVAHAYLARTLRFGRWQRALFDFLLAALVGGFIAHELGVLAKWSGKTLAAAQLAAQGIAALSIAIAAGLWLVRECLARGKALRGWALGASAFCAGSAAVAGYVDAHFWVRQYGSVHETLRLLVLFFATLSALALATLLERPALRRRHLAAVALLGALLSALFLRDPGDLHVVLARRLPRVLVLLGRTLTDFDGDGYGALFGGLDCAPLEATRHPLVREVPGDGIDQDCRGGDAKTPRPKATSTQAGSLSPATAASTSVLLVTVDTFRPDRLSRYGAARDPTPQLTVWSRGAAQFERAYTSGGMTSLALPSLFRGVYPRRMRFTRVFETQSQRLLRARELGSAGSDPVLKGFALPLSDPRPTLSQLLGARGYLTAAVVDDGSTSYFQPSLGAFPHFARYHTLDQASPRLRSDAATSEAAVAMLESMPQERPFFMWVHYFGPHAPDTFHEGIPRFGSDAYARYDHELAFFDSALARLLEATARLSARRSLAVIITGDHGEEFSANERDHGQTLSEAATRIPLWLKVPGLAARSCDVAVSLVDVMPTILALTGTPLPEGLDGSDLRALPCHAQGEPRTVALETWRLDHRGRVQLSFVGLSDGNSKVTLDTLRLDAAALELTEQGEQDVPFSARHLLYLDRLYGYLGEDGPLRFTPVH